MNTTTALKIDGKTAEALQAFFAASFNSAEFCAAKDRLFDLLYKAGDSLGSVQTRINKLAKKARAAGWKSNW